MLNIEQAGRQFLCCCCCCCCFQTSWLHYRNHGNKFMTYSIQITILWQLKLVNIQVILTCDLPKRLYSQLCVTMCLLLEFHVHASCLVLYFLQLLLLLCVGLPIYCNKLCLHVHDVLHVLTRGNKKFVFRIRFSYFIHNVLRNVLSVNKMLLKRCCNGVHLIHVCDVCHYLIILPVCNTKLCNQYL